MRFIFDGSEIADNMQHQSDDVLIPLCPLPDQYQLRINRELVNKLEDVRNEPSLLFQRR